MRKKLIYGIVIMVLLSSVILAACAAPAPTPGEKVSWRHQCAYDTADKVIWPVPWIVDVKRTCDEHSGRQVLMCLAKMSRR